MEHDSVSITILRLWQLFDLGSLVQGATKYKCRTAFRKLAQFLGDVPAESVSVPVIGQWQVWLRDVEHLSCASVRSYFASVSQVYAWGRDVQLVTNDAFAKARPLRMPRREVVVFDRSEVSSLVEAASQVQRSDPSAGMRWTAMLLLAAHSGLRVGEILNLRWEDLDLDAGLVHVRYRPDAMGQHWTWGSKTDTDRTVPMSQDALEILHRLAEIATWRYPMLKWSTCVRLQRMVGGIPEDVRKLPYRNFHREFGQIRKAADRLRRSCGLPAMKNGGLHQLRKTAVTAWARQGVPLIDAQCVAGHRSMQTTRNYYIAIDAEASVGRVRAVIDANPGRQ